MFKKNPNYIDKKEKNELIVCPHCLISSKDKSFIRRYHFDNCKQNPDYIDRRPILVCPHCRYEGKNKGNMVKFHFDNCKLKNI